MSSNADFSVMLLFRPNSFISPIASDCLIPLPMGTWAVLHLPKWTEPCCCYCFSTWLGLFRFTPVYCPNMQKSNYSLIMQSNYYWIMKIPFRHCPPISIANSFASERSALACNGMRWNLDGIQPDRSLTGWILEFVWAEHNLSGASWVWAISPTW